MNVGDLVEPADGCEGTTWGNRKYGLIVSFRESINMWEVRWMSKLHRTNGEYWHEEELKIVNQVLTNSIRRLQ